MASVFESKFEAAGRRKLLALLGEAVTYNPLGVAGSSITAILNPGPEREQFGDDGKWHIRAASVVCSDVDTSSPSNRDTFTIGGEEWQVDDEIGFEHDSPGGIVEFPLVIKTRIEVSGPDHRLRR